MIPTRSPGLMPRPRSSPATRAVARSSSRYVIAVSPTRTATRSACTPAVSTRFDARLTIVIPLRPRGGEAAVDGQHRTGRPLRLACQQKDGCLRDVLGGAQPWSRRLRVYASGFPDAGQRWCAYRSFGRGWDGQPNDHAAARADIACRTTVKLSPSVTKRQCPVWQVRCPAGQSRLLPPRPRRRPAALRRRHRQLPGLTSMITLVCKRRILYRSIRPQDEEKSRRPSLPHLFGNGQTVFWSTR